MLKETRYIASRNYSPLKVFVSIIKDLPQSSALGYELAKRNIKAKYRKSFLGILWAFFPPLFTAFIWIVLQRQGLFKFPELTVPYPLFVVCGTFLWQIFVAAVNSPIQVVQANQATLVKINFPREALFFAAVVELLFTTCVSFIIIIAALLWYGVVPTNEFIFFIPYLFGLILIGFCISLFILPFALLFTDLLFFLPFVLQLGMYLTPVVYPKLMLSGFSSFLDYNPLEPFITGARDSLLGIGDTIPGFGFFIGILVLLILLAMGLVLLRISMNILIERMGS